MFQNNRRSKARLSSVTHPVQHFSERSMSDAMEEHDGKVSIDGGNITNLRFADDIYALAEEEQVLEALLKSLNKTCARYKMKISAEKTKLMTNSANCIQRGIKVSGRSWIPYQASSTSEQLFQSRESLKDCISYCSSYKAEANPER